MSIRGRFEIPKYARLDKEQAKFLETFLRCRGMLNSVERELNLSYPTVRARLGHLVGSLRPDASSRRERTEGKGSRPQAQDFGRVGTRGNYARSGEREVGSVTVKDEVQRISKLVAEGRLSPEDAADLIDAFYASDRGPQDQAEQGEAGYGNGSPPPPPPHSDSRDPFRGFVESIEKMTKEGIESVNWQEVARHARENAKKGVDAVRTGIEDLSKGKVHFGWAFNQEVKELTLPLSLAEGKILKIENPCGNIKIVGGFDKGSVTARARFKAASLEEARAKATDYTLIVEESDHAVEIKQPDVSGLCVELEIQLAGAGSVEIRTESGDIQVLDTKGGARISSRSGNIQLRGLIGSVEISADSGNLS